MSARILLAEDDESIATLIKMTLAIEKHETIHMSDGLKAMEAIHSQDFDIALLDIMLPKLNGYTLLEELKKKGIPAIFITAKTALSDKVHGLTIGAEDYITKPFEPLELLARVNTALRRIKPTEDDKIRVGNVVLDSANHIVILNGREVGLTPLEYELLELLMRNPNLLFSREQILDKIWGYDYYGGTRTVDMHVQKLRAKLDFANVIRTVHKIGYRLEPPKRIEVYENEE